MTKYIIADWAGNIMDTFQMTVAYKVAMDIPPTEFESFDDAEDFLCEVLDDNYEEDRGEYYIEEVGEIRNSKFLDPNEKRKSQSKKLKVSK